MIERIRELLAPETAGDPMSGLKWCRRTPAKIAAQLRSLGWAISARTAARLVRSLGYSLRVNRKAVARTCHPQRDAQFQRIARLRTRCFTEGTPIISVDAKKKELIGRFKNPGAKLDREPEAVLDHDFRSDAEGRAVPYGIFDLQANHGFFAVGTSGDTPAFAVDAIATWWRETGRERYPGARRLVILADSGGSNGYRPRAWKVQLQHQLCDAWQLAVTVAHYPSGCSKWNPVEHRLFSFVSINWAGRPLDSFETVLNYLRSTTTKQGLRVAATLMSGTYESGVKVSDQQMHALNLTKETELPQWNYTLRPTTKEPSPTADTPAPVGH